MSEHVPFAPGARVRMFDHQGAFVDDAEVLLVKECNVRFWSGDTAVAEVQLRSLQLEPNVVRTMVLVIELGWRVLDDDPLQDGVQCVALQPEAEYRIEVL